jgi:hypothetical protein
MHFKVKNAAALRVVLGDLPGRTPVEIDPRVKLSAKTVSDLRKVTDFPEALAVTRSTGGHSEHVVRVTRPNVATRTSPKQ